MIDSNVSSAATPLVGLQMLFVAFGALALVPILTGLDPSVALFTAGVGTLLFQFVTGRQVPIFLASSFAFIAPIIYSVQTWGIPATLSGLFAAGLVYMLLSFIVATRGRAVIDRVLPPLVIGPVIMVIGLSLAPVAVNLALGRTGDGAVRDELQAEPALTSMPSSWRIARRAEASRPLAARSKPMLLVLVTRRRVSP